MDQEYLSRRTTGIQLSYLKNRLMTTLPNYDKFTLGRNLLKIFSDLKESVLESTLSTYSQLRLEQEGIHCDVN